MGGGIALTFKKKFNRVNYLKKQDKDVGEVAVLKDSERWIYYLITKEHYYQIPKYYNLKNALKAMRKHCERHNVKYVAMPKIGCGLDRLDFTIVKYIIIIRRFLRL